MVQACPAWFLRAADARCAAAEVQLAVYVVLFMVCHDLITAGHTWVALITDKHTEIKNDLHPDLGLRTALSVRGAVVPRET